MVLGVRRGSTTRYQVFRTTTGTCNATDATFQVDYITSFGTHHRRQLLVAPGLLDRPAAGRLVSLPVNQDPVKQPDETYDLADTIAMRNAPACP